MSRPLGLGLALVLVMLPLTGCGGDAEPETASPPATTAPPPPPPAAGGGEEDAIRGSGGGSATTTAAEGERVPEIVGPTLAGGTASLSDFRGKKVIVHLWSSW
jgi:hypothetical protein